MSGLSKYVIGYSQGLVFAHGRGDSSSRTIDPVTTTARPLNVSHAGARMRRDLRPAPEMIGVAG